ncbi:hypothetical protein QQ73_21410, partial [Candidatus Endoriftia persephone str. Guaymas]|nr:hypothetical protein [Candidatus Endoriftia persephone str. Guaymas]
PEFVLKLGWSVGRVLGQEANSRSTLSSLSFADTRRVFQVNLKAQKQDHHRLRRQAENNTFFI